MSKRKPVLIWRLPLVSVQDEGTSGAASPVSLPLDDSLLEGFAAASSRVKTNDSAHISSASPPPPMAKSSGAIDPSTIVAFASNDSFASRFDSTNDSDSSPAPTSPIPRSPPVASSSSDDPIDSYLQRPYAADLVKIRDGLVTALENNGYRGVLELVHELEGRFAPQPDQSKLLASPDIFYDHGLILLAQNDNEVLKAMIRGTLPAQYSNPQWRSDHSVEQVSQHHSCPGIYVNFIWKASGAEFRKDEFDEILRLMLVYVESNKYDETPLNR